MQKSYQFYDINVVICGNDCDVFLNGCSYELSIGYGVQARINSKINTAEIYEYIIQELTMAVDANKILGQDAYRGDPGLRRLDIKMKLKRFKNYWGEMITDEYFKDFK